MGFEVNLGPLKFTEFARPQAQMIAGDCKAFEMRRQGGNQLPVVGIFHKSLASIIEFEQTKMRRFAPVETGLFCECEASANDR